MPLRRTTPLHDAPMHRTAPAILQAAAMAVALCALSWPAVAAGGFSLGAGILSARLSSEALESGSGAGWEVSAGYRTWERVSFDLYVAKLGDPATRATTTISYPPDVAEASFLGLGLRVDLLSLEARRWTPWLGAGFGYAMLNWEHFFYIQDGGGVYLAAGADVELLAGLILRGRLTRARASMSDNYEHDAPGFSATTGSLAIVYEFGRSRAGWRRW